MRIAHISDLHFGRIADDEIVAALQADVNAGNVDLVCISGDLTMRGKRREFRLAARALEGFDAPVLVVPGNHDVYDWRYPISRLATPMRRYRQYISRDLAPTFEREGIAVLGLNTAYGHSFKGGRITSRHLVQMRHFFAGQPPATFKVLVIHHHLMRLRALGRHDVARRARRALQLAVALKVDMVLCGHLHQSHIEPVRISGHRLVIASAGTVTSNRWRGPHRKTNFYGLIEVEEKCFRINERAYTGPEDGFEHYEEVVFERD
jgi:3',5'-cyclic AMP phosphodiesterase CpdA